MGYFIDFYAGWFYGALFSYVITSIFTAILKINYMWDDLSIFMRVDFMWDYFNGGLFWYVFVSILTAILKINFMWNILLILCDIFWFYVGLLYVFILWEIEFKKIIM